MATGAKTDSKGNGYVVLVDRLVLKTGPKTEDAVSYRRGQVVNPNADHTDIERMVALKALAPNDGEAKVATTARAAAQAAGAADDTAANVPVHETLPVQPEGTDDSGLLHDNDE